MFRRYVLLIAATLPMAVAADVRVVEEIAAKVNGDIITRGELESQKRDLERGLRGEGLSGQKLQEEVRNYAANALRDQIDQLLLVQKAKDLNINVDPEVTRELADIQVRAKISDPDKFKAYIQEQTGMSYEDYAISSSARCSRSASSGRKSDIASTSPKPTCGSTTTSTRPTMSVKSRSSSARS